MEEWKQIEGFEHSISNLGRVRNDRTGYIFKYRLGPRGYPRTNITYKKKHRCCFIHKLIAIAFIPNPENKLQVNHKNFIHDDNRIENLEWVTDHENREHAKINGRWKGMGLHRLGIRNGMAKLNEKQVLEIKKLLKTKKYTQEKIGNMFNVSRSAILGIHLGNNWRWLNENTTNT